MDVISGISLDDTLTEFFQGYLGMFCLCERQIRYYFVTGSVNALTIKREHILYREVD